MKKLSLFKIIFFCYLQFLLTGVKAQTLYGTTFNGGADKAGTINTFIPATNELTAARTLTNFGAYPAYSSFIQAANGKLYAMTAYGGGSSGLGCGVIFSVDPSSLACTKLHNFDCINGGLPQGSLVEASNGKLYGVTDQGGSDGAGVIFSLDPSTSIYTKLKDFNSNDNPYPRGSLVQASDGKLYGMTAGAIFSYDPSSSVYMKLHVFDNVNGGDPRGSLIQAKDGKLYGMTLHGGSKQYGVIFSFDPSNFTYTKLKDLDETNGRNPYGSFVQAADGKLYGMTCLGGGKDGGVIFSFDPSTFTYTKLKDLDSNTGNDPFGSLVKGRDGKLYGMTSGGGGKVKSYGTIFCFDPVSSTYTKLKSFDLANGGNPYGNLLQAKDGRFYGMTCFGGRANFGVTFSFDPFALLYTKLLDFAGSENGSNISASLVQASDGKLYGVTTKGGSRDSGVIFSFDPSSFTYKKLKDFDNMSGSNSFGSLTRASDGKLFGLTNAGGSNGLGVIFSFDPFSSVYTKLKDLDSAGGSNPYGNLIYASDGKLYGMTTKGGAGNCGVIFCFDPSLFTYKTLKDFDKISGANPYGGLIQASDGKLYGMTSAGGSPGFGVIFSLDPLLLKYIKLKDFDSTNGANPYGNLVQADDGKLYGMTGYGGSSGASGVLFSYDPSSSMYKKLNDFNGGYPLGNLMQAGDGKLYGMTQYGGSSSRAGIIFSYDPSTSTYAKLKDFDGINGANPYIGAGFIEMHDLAPHMPPAVSLTTPLDNATYLSGGNVYLTAVASDLDGTVSKVEFYNGPALLHTATGTPYTFKWEHVQRGNYALTAKATDNSGLVTVSATIHIMVVANKPPTVSIVSPATDQTFLTGATVHLQAVAKDVDGRVGKVAFYNDTTLLAIEEKLPYTFDWRIGKAGNYTITARATDNWGATTTSAAIPISIIPNQPPAVNITTPANGQIFTAALTGATINIEAVAQDADGRVAGVYFYNGATLLTSEHKTPYTYHWQNLPAGTYTLTAVAKDNWGAETTAAPVTITIIPGNEPLVSNRSASPQNGRVKMDAVQLNLTPNPAKSILSISTTGLQKNKRLTLSVISSSGLTIESRQLSNLMANGSTQAIQLNVSSLLSGIYIIKITADDRIVHKKFVKM